MRPSLRSKQIIVEERKRGRTKGARKIGGKKKTY